MMIRCPKCAAFAVAREHDSAYCGACFLTFRPSAPAAALPQLDIFGAEHVLAPSAEPGTRPVHEQPRLFEPQYEGQLAMAGGDYPENGAEAPER